MSRDVRDLPSGVRRKVATILADYSDALTEAQRALIVGDLVRCARILDKGTDKLIKAVRLIREG